MDLKDTEMEEWKQRSSAIPAKTCARQQRGDDNELVSYQEFVIQQNNSINPFSNDEAATRMLQHNTNK